jgi:hypothetical protein
MRSISSGSLVCLALCALCASAGPTPGAAQATPELPQPSPKARVEQHVGLADLSIDYSSPAVKGRKIWGELVPYDKPWRTGANAATRLTTNRDLTFAGKPLKAGSYALYTIPSKASWTLVLNSGLEAWGNDGYDPSKDVLRVTLKPSATTSSRERMTFIFSDTSDNAAKLDLEWEKLQLRIPIELDTKAEVATNIQNAVDDAWRPHFAAARYLLENGGDLDKAMQYIDLSIAIKATWWNNWVRAQLLAKKGHPQDAAAGAERAIALGSGDRTFEMFFKPEVNKSLAAWKKKP